MNLLLDTHALVWWLNDDVRLSATARAGLNIIAGLFEGRPLFQDVLNGASKPIKLSIRFASHACDLPQGKHEQK